MGYYLLDHPPASRQFYPPPRARQPTGAVGVHTTESVMDTVDVDTGAENVAGFISRRPDPGSYHEIVDSDSVIELVPDDYTAFAIGVPGFNSSTWSIALACREDELDPDHWWTRQAIGRLGERIRAYWERTGIDPVSAAWWGTADDALAGPCLFHHGTAQPRDRSDAWARHPQRARLEQMLVDAIATPNTTQPQQEDWSAMATAEEIRSIVAAEVRAAIGHAVAAPWRLVTCTARQANGWFVHLYGDGAAGPALFVWDGPPPPAPVLGEWNAIGALGINPATGGAWDLTPSEWDYLQAFRTDVPAGWPGA